LLATLIVMVALSLLNYGLKMLPSGLEPEKRKQNPEATQVLLIAIERGIADIPFAAIAQRLIYGINNFPILAIPCFLLAGKLMNEAGVTVRIFRFANSLVGHLPGGLGHANVVASVIFSGMSGSAIGDIVAMGPIEIRAMREAGFPHKFSVAITAASSLIGPIIPPSIPMVIYGVMAGVSVGALFMGGFMIALALEKKLIRLLLLVDLFLNILMNIRQQRQLARILFMFATSAALR
jgi:tripartite ATP-independent transporter DctM subunit